MQWLAQSARPRSCAAGSTTGGDRATGAAAAGGAGAGCCAASPTAAHRTMANPVEHFCAVPILIGPILIESSSGRYRKRRIVSQDERRARCRGRRWLCCARSRRGCTARRQSPDRTRRGTAPRESAWTYRRHFRSGRHRPLVGRHSRRPHRCLGARRGLVALLRRSERHPLLVGRRAARQPPWRSQRLAGAAHRRRDRRLAGRSPAVLRGGAAPLPHRPSLDRTPLSGECRRQRRLGDSHPLAAAQQLRVPDRDRRPGPGVDRDDGPGLRGRPHSPNRAAPGMDNPELCSHVRVRRLPAVARPADVARDREGTEIVSAVSWMCWALPLLVTEVVLSSRKIVQTASARTRVPGT